MDNMDNVGALVEEYQTTLNGIEVDDSESLARTLQETGEWTTNASEHLVALVNNYGAFMLRNALAIAIAVEVEDGNLGF